MNVVLADTVITVQGWPHALDGIGDYRLRIRKTPEETKAERARKRAYDPGCTPRIDPYRYEHGTVVSVEGDTAYFLPGLWPRVKAKLDDMELSYTVEDRRNPDIRPPLEIDRLEGVQFRSNQDVAIALVAVSDCGVIETPTAFGKCHGANDRVLMFDCTSKAAKDVRKGDLLMGPDGSARIVLHTNQGFGKLYRMHPRRGDDHLFTGNHILVLQEYVPNTGRGRPYCREVEMTVKEYMALPPTRQSYMRAMFAEVDPIVLEDRPASHPYIVGLYLARYNGRHEDVIPKGETGIWEKVRDIMDSMPWCREEEFLNDSQTQYTYVIPPGYRNSSREDRMELLAGLLDGSQTTACKTMLHLRMWEGDWRLPEVKWLAVSVGLYCSQAVHVRKKGVVIQLSIKGDVKSIPLRRRRLQKLVSRQLLTPCERARCSQFYIEPAGLDCWYGFTVDADHRYLMSDLMITHNSFCIAQLCKALPSLNIVVATRSAQVVGTLCQYISKELPGEVGRVSGGTDTSAGKRVVVTTLKSLPKIDETKVHMVLVDECHDVGANEAGQALQKFCFARRFGFSASPVRNDGSGIVMESILGPTILKMEYQESVDAGMVTPMKYLMMPCPACPEMARNMAVPDVFRKRWSYWCNNYRNKMLASFIRKVKDVYDGQVLIMVSTLEHAIQLHLLLPWFKVAFHGGGDPMDLAPRFPKTRFPDLDLKKYRMKPKDLDIMRMAYEKGTLKWVITTKTWRQGVNLVHLSLLVRADGDVSEVDGIQIPGRLSRLDEGKDKAYLVDFADTFSPWAEERYRKREATYLKQGWTPVTEKELLDDLGGRAEGGRRGGTGLG